MGGEGGGIFSVLHGIYNTNGSKFGLRKEFMLQACYRV